jgi:hypothetical protein
MYRTPSWWNILRTSISSDCPLGGMRSIANLQVSFQGNEHLISASSLGVRKTYPSKPNKLATFPALIASSTSSAVLQSWKSSEYFSMRLIETSICSNASDHQSSTTEMLYSVVSFTSNTICCVYEIRSFDLGRTFSEATY